MLVICNAESSKWTGKTEYVFVTHRFQYYITYSVFPLAAHRIAIDYTSLSVFPENHIIIVQNQFTKSLQLRSRGQKYLPFPITSFRDFLVLISVLSVCLPRSHLHKVACNYSAPRSQLTSGEFISRVHPGCHRDTQYTLTRAYLRFAWFYRVELYLIVGCISMSLHVSYPWRCSPVTGQNIDSRCQTMPDHWSCIEWTLTLWVLHESLGTTVRAIRDQTIVCLT